MRGRMRNWATLVSIETLAKLRDQFGWDNMNSRHVLRSGCCAVLLAIAVVPSAGAEGTFDIPMSAISIQRSGFRRLGEFFHNEVTTGKIPRAILLIQQHGNAGLS